MAARDSTARTATTADTGLSRTARNVWRATLGAPPLLAQHAWRQRYIERINSDEVAFSEAMPPAQPATTGSTVQKRDDGCGPIVMRTFEARITDPVLTPVELMGTFRRRPNDFVPRHIAGFVDGDSAVESMQVGDEFTVEIPGPWNGPVRVDAIDDTSVMLVTLDGHMEAGHIRFAVVKADADGYRFQVRSWARAGDEMFHHLHLVVGIAHEAQTAMWVHTCDRAVAVSGGRRRSRITARTETLLDSERTC